MSRTYLTTTYPERAAAKALGARWDDASRKWYVPQGVDLAPFAKWLPASPASTPAEPTLAVLNEDAHLPASARGQSLSQLLQAASAAVAGVFPRAQWVIVEVVSVRDQKHFHLEVTERSPDGTVLAQARAVIWAQTAARIMPTFHQATGIVVGPGMKLLVRAKPTLHTMYGLSLIIEAIDPDYSLGDLEARKREVRTRLQEERIWTNNKELARPWDYSQVLVVSPADAAGLGDFRADADRLEAAGLCTFTYASARFQGEGAGAEIVAATSKALAQWARRTSTKPDAVVIIRGGGAVSDLAWLNDYGLCRFICLLDVPVLCGIGHERDNTLVDEVAHTRFDTPSKVIHGIMSVIHTNALTARTALRDILNAAKEACQRAGLQAQQGLSAVSARAHRQLAMARDESQRTHDEVQRGALKALSTAKSRTAEDVTAVRTQAALQLALAKERAPQVLQTVKSQAAGQLQLARERASLARQEVLGLTGQLAQRARSDVAGLHAACAQDARRMVTNARVGSQSLMREIAGQGPEKTLARGFALVRTQDGSAITSAAQLTESASITMTFRDGEVPAIVSGPSQNSETPQK